MHNASGRRGTLWSQDLLWTWSECPARGEAGSPFACFPGSSSIIIFLFPCQELSFTGDWKPMHYQWACEVKAERTGRGQSPDSAASLLGLGWGQRLAWWECGQLMEDIGLESGAPVCVCECVICFVQGRYPDRHGLRWRQRGKYIFRWSASRTIMVALFWEVLQALGYKV